MLLNLNKDQKLINELIQEFNKRKTIADKQYNYYIGKTDAYRNYEVNEDRCNRKVNDNFIKTFIDEEVSFMVGQPITYVSKSNNKQCIDDDEFEEVKNFKNELKHENGKYYMYVYPSEKHMYYAKMIINL